MKNYYVLLAETRCITSPNFRSYYIYKQDTYNPENKYEYGENILLYYSNLNSIGDLINKCKRINNKETNFFTEKEINDEEFIKELFNSFKELNDRDELFKDMDIIIRFIPISDLKTIYWNLNDDEADDENNKLEKEIDKIKNDFSQMSEDLKDIKDLLKKVLNI